MSDWIVTTICVEVTFCVRDDSISFAEPESFEGKAEVVVEEVGD